MAAAKISPKSKSKANMKDKYPDFVFDYQVKMPEYNGVQDKYLVQFFEKKQIRRHLRKMGIQKKNNDPNKENIKKKEFSPLKLKTEAIEILEEEDDDESEIMRAIEMRKYAHSTNINRKQTPMKERGGRTNILPPVANMNSFTPIKSIHTEASSTRNKFNKSFYGVDSYSSSNSYYNTQLRANTPKLRDSHDGHKPLFVHQYDIPKSTKSQLDNYPQPQVKPRERSHSSMNSYQANKYHDQKGMRITANENNFPKQNMQLRTTPTPKHRKRNNSVNSNKHQYEEEMVKTSTHITGQQLKNILDKYRLKVQESIDRQKMFNQTQTRYSPKSILSNDDVPQKPHILSSGNSNPNSNRAFSTVKERPFEESERKKTKSISIQTLAHQEQINSQQISIQQNSVPNDEYQNYLQQNNLFTLNPQKMPKKQRSTIDSKFNNSILDTDQRNKYLDYSLINTSNVQQFNLQDQVTANFSYLRENVINNNSSFRQKRSLTPKPDTESIRIPTEKDEKRSIQSKRRDQSRIGLTSNGGTINEDSQCSYNQDKPPISIQSNKNQDDISNSSYQQYNEYIQQKSLILPQIQTKQKISIKNDREYLDESLLNYNSQLNLENYDSEDKLKGRKKYQRRIAQSPELNEIIHIGSNSSLQIKNNTQL